MSAALTRAEGGQTYADVIRAAIPDATPDDCEHVLWERTPYPVDRVTARDLYRAASRVRRAEANGVRLCDLCDNRAEDGLTCNTCRRVLHRATQATSSPQPSPAAPQEEGA